jgi:cytochrome c
LRLRAAFAFTLFFLHVEAKAQDSLISGPGATLTENKCKICHELQHVRRSKLSRGEWADNLRNMKERGTPMDDAEMAVILDYLSTYYGRGAAPAAGPDTLASADADPVKKILDANGCSGCHSLDQRVVGPSFREVSLKYKDDPAAKDRLIAKIRQGGQGAWGAVPMPPNPAASDADLDAVVTWVLSRK